MFNATMATVQMYAWAIIQPCLFSLLVQFNLFQFETSANFKASRLFQPLMFASQYE